METAAGALARCGVAIRRFGAVARESDEIFQSGRKKIKKGQLLTYYQT